MQLFKFLLLPVILCQNQPFLGDKVYQVDLAKISKVQLKAWNDIKSSLNIDLWSERLSSYAQVMVKKDEVQAFEQALSEEKIDFKVEISDLQSAVHQSDRESKIIAKHSKRQNIARSVFDDYQDYDVLVRFIQGLPEAKPINIGKSYEKRDIKGSILGSGPKHIIITAGVHAREWIAPATAIYFASFLSGSSEKATDLKSKFTFHIIPCLNPDGYTLSRKEPKFRFWRKNTQIVKGQIPETCFGTDINRNFPSGWEAGVSEDQCADVYAGTEALSSPEAKALVDYSTLLKGKIVASLDLHSFAQTWLIPYGYKKENPKDFEIQLEAAKKATDAMTKTNGITFNTESISSFARFYLVGGSQTDYFYDNFNVKFSASVELRGNGGPLNNPRGFDPPPKSIVLSGSEATNGIIAYCDFISQH